MPIDLSSYPDAPFLLSRPESKPSGLDFLGMAQDNFNLMAACIPGISNTTAYVRPFSLMCWTYWRFHKAFDGRKTKVAEAELRRFREKIESVFLWSHKLAGSSARMPGSRSKAPKADAKGLVSLEFNTWKPRRSGDTSYMAPVQYRPALTDAGGLGFLRRVERTFYQVTSRGRQLAEAIDAELRHSDAFEFLCDPKSSKVSEAEAEAIFEHWDLEDTSKSEAKVFAAALFDANSVPLAAQERGRTLMAERSAFIQLIMDALSQSDSAIGVDALREFLALRTFTDGSQLMLKPGPLTQSKRWLLLQIRQVQRQAIEGLLAWVENQLCGGLRTPEDLWRAAREDVESSRRFLGRSATVDEALRRCLPAECDSFTAYAQWLFSGDGHQSIFSLMEELGAKIKAYEHSCSDCLALLMTLARMWDWVESDFFLRTELARHSSAQRLPLSQWRQAVERHRSRRPAELLEWTLRNLVLSQHFSIATQRHEIGKPRLRIAIEEYGFQPLVDDPWRPQATPDRIAALLSLMESCHMLEWDSEQEGYVRNS